VKHVFQNFEPFLANRALKFKKKCYYDLKTFSSQNLSMGVGTAQNFAMIWNLFRKMQKNLLTKNYRQKKCAKLEFVPFYTTTCTNFRQINFSRYTFFNLFPRIWNRRGILRFFRYSYVKKEIIILGSWSTYMSIFGNSRMQIRKKWLNQWKDFFNRYFKEYYLASFCS
jgi:hypothetical protein